MHFFTDTRVDTFSTFFRKSVQSKIALEKIWILYKNKKLCSPWNPLRKIIKWTDRRSGLIVLLIVRKLSLQLVLGLSIQPLLFPLTLFNTKFEPYTVRFRLSHSNPHNNLSSWYSYNYNLNIFRQPIPLDTRCIFIVLIFLRKTKTRCFGSVLGGEITFS